MGSDTIGVDVNILRNVVYIQFAFLGAMILLIIYLIAALYKNTKQWSAARRYLSVRHRVRDCETAAERWAEVEKTLFESRRQLIDDQFQQINANMCKLLPAESRPLKQVRFASTFQSDEFPPPPTDDELKEIVGQG